METTTLLIDTDAAGVLTPRGELSPDTADELRTVLHKNLVDHVRVLVDLGSLKVTARSAAHVFGSALADAGGWPAARLVLFGADAPTRDMLRAERVATAVPVAADLDAARPLLGIRPGRITRRCELPCDVAAAAQARAFVASVCANWAVTSRVLDATLITNELVSNAVTHARTASLLALSHDQHGLHVAVRDECAQGVDAIRMGQARGGDGRGLYLISELSNAWGVSPHPDGKTVWAVLGR